MLIRLNALTNLHRSPESEVGGGAQENIVQQSVAGAAEAKEPSMGELRAQASDEMFGTTMPAEQKKESDAAPKEPNRGENAAEQLATENQYGAVKPKGEKRTAKYNFGKMTRLNRELEAKNAALTKRVQELENKRSEPLDTEGMSDKDAIAAGVMRNVEIKSEEDAINAESARIAQERNRAFEETVNELFPEQESRGQFVNDYNKYADAVAANEPELSEVFLQSPIGPMILDEFFRDMVRNAEPGVNERNYSAWRSLSPNSKRVMLANIEQNIIRRLNAPEPQQQAEQQPKRSSAPVIPAPTASGAKPGGEDASMKGMREAAKRQLFS